MYYVQKAKTLKSLGKIYSFCISGDKIKIKVSENSLSLSITHIDDLCLSCFKFSSFFFVIKISPYFNFQKLSDKNEALLYRNSIILLNFRERKFST